MLLKAFGCILIFFSSIGVGLNYIKKLKNRVAALCEACEFINIVKIKMCYELCDIPNLFQTLSDKYFIAQKSSIHIKNGNSLKIAWDKSIDEYAEELHLKAEDVSILKDFCTCLGQTDIEGQTSNFNMYSKLMEKNLKEAKNELSDKSRVIFSTSTFVGLLISILLI